MKDDHDFKLVKQFPGYNSASDKTTLPPGTLIRGSKNVVKKLSGTIANREGLKRRGSADSTLAGVKSSFEWTTSQGYPRALRVCNNKLQVESDIVASGTYVWYDLLEESSLASPAATLTRFVFDTWWDNDEKKDRLIMVRGDDKLLHWTGGIALLDGGYTSSISLVGNSASLTTFSTDFNNTGDFVIDSNGSIGESLEGAIVLKDNPSDGDSFTVSVNGNNIQIFFVSTIGAVPGNVLIGASADATRDNLLGLLQNPGTTSSTQVALGAAAQTALSYITFASSNAIVKQGTESWTELGFASVLAGEKIIIANSTEFTYSYSAGTVLTGISTSVSSLTSGMVALQAVLVEDNLPADGYDADFIKVIQNQLWVGSYTSRLVYISGDSNIDGLGFLDFSNAGSLLVGDPDNVVLDAPGKGIGVLDGKVFVFSGDSDAYIITPNFDLPVSQAVTPLSGGSARLVIQKVDKKQLPGLTAALGHEFIGNFNEYLVWLDQKNRLRAIGHFSNIDAIKPITLSLPVQTELSEDDFTGGHLRVVDDTIHITAPNTGRDWMYQIRESLDPNGQVVSERLWQPPQIRGISRFAVIGGITYGHSNVNPQLYRIFDTEQFFDDNPDDEYLPYASVARFAYMSHDLRQGLLTFEKIFVEGYMTQGTKLNMNIYSDYQGFSSFRELVVNDTGNEADFFFGNPYPSLGDSSLGDNPLGQGIIPEGGDQENLPKFRVILDTQQVNCFEYGLEFVSLSEDSRWELLFFGANTRKAAQKATFLRK